jgi:cell division protein FtsA
MARSGLYTGVDIGTDSIKVLVAEYISNEMNIIGVGNAKSDGLKNGIIVDIEKVAVSLRQAVNIAEERAGIRIDNINVSIPANQLEIERCQGMIPLIGESREINDGDVLQVVSNAMMRGIAPEREIINVEATEFTVDGFEGISDPRGMFGVRLEVRGLIYSGPKTLVHNIRKVVERAGLLIDNLVLAPLAMSRYILSEGEGEFGTLLIDFGAGQTTVTGVRDQRIQFSTTSSEGGDYITKDISMVLNTSLDEAEELKKNYGEASVERASQDEYFSVNVVGRNEPEQYTEQYLSQVIEARIMQICEGIRQVLNANSRFDLPGGIILAGGAAAMPGMSDLVSQVLGYNTRLFIPSEMGLRNPTFAHVISIVNYIGSRSEIDILVAQSTNQEQGHNATVDYQYGNEQQTVQPNVQPVKEENEEVEIQPYVPIGAEKEEENEGIVNRVRNMFGNLFE